MPEPPLSDHELRVIRGMIDEYEREEQRSRVLRDFFEDTTNLLKGFAWLVLVLLSIAQLYAILHGHP